MQSYVLGQVVRAPNFVCVAVHPQAERLRAKESYTPRAAYTSAKAELTSREINLLQKGTDDAAGTARSAVRPAKHAIRECLCTRVPLLADMMVVVFTEKGGTAEHGKSFQQG